MTIVDVLLQIERFRGGLADTIANIESQLVGAAHGGSPTLAFVPVWVPNIVPFAFDLRLYLWSNYSAVSRGMVGMPAKTLLRAARTF